MKKLIALILATLALACLLASCGATFNPADYEIKTITIQSGDSLYGYACKYCLDDDNRDEYIEALKDLNKCSALIYAGEKIKIYKAK